MLVLWMGYLKCHCRIVHIIWPMLSRSHSLGWIIRFSLILRERIIITLICSIITQIRMGNSKQVNILRRIYPTITYLFSTITISMLQFPWTFLPFNRQQSIPTTTTITSLRRIARTTTTIISPQSRYQKSVQIAFILPVTRTLLNSIGLTPLLFSLCLLWISTTTIITKTKMLIIHIIRMKNPLIHGSSTQRDKTRIIKMKSWLCWIKTRISDIRINHQRERRISSNKTRNNS